jgi:two-component system, OmpR family, sensor histidine kinase MprB
VTDRLVPPAAQAAADPERTITLRLRPQDTRPKRTLPSFLPIEVRWPRWLTWRPRDTLQRRIVWLTALAVGISVAIAGIGAYASTQISLYAQLDAELLSVANITAASVAPDIESTGGLNADALRAANVVLVLVKSNKDEVVPPGETVPFDIGSEEIAIARTQQGSSARTAVSSTGELYRIVAVPLTTQTEGQTSGDGYALVLGRSLEPTLTTLRQMTLVLLAVAILGVIAAAISGWAVAGSSLQPIRRLALAVARITETDELIQIEAEGDNELADLSRSFNSMMRSLASSRERQSRLIADAGHELRTPLTSLRTNIELLIADEKSGMLPEGARSDILRDVAAQLGEFTQLVGDLVQLSREDHVEAARLPIDLQDVVANAVTRAKRRGPTMMFDVHLAEHELVGNPDTLERALTNLLDNAVKFSPNGGLITVTMKDQTVVVSDQGPGIADEDLPHVFDRFYRSDLSRNTPGTGLGLSIVAHTINSHGGWVKAGKAPEGGAEFTVWLPTTAEDNDAE